MKCPRCQSHYIRKNGKPKGRQNYIFSEFGRQFIEYKNQKCFSDEINR
ncbi:MAG: hypothetical protein HGA42_18800 [Nostocales cyanobacterium W4_Combined_metabat2_030]|nr:hypothetical protein [Nostocales cyanobacterium W4_Combined_metabat2_030]